MKWAYGVTVVPERFDLVQQTLISLASAGFEEPRIFLDSSSSYEMLKFSGNVSLRLPRIGAFANWILGLAELFLRNLDADRFAMFEDDITLCRNVRQYLEQCSFPGNSYQNLYTTEDNRPKLVGASSLVEVGWGYSKQGGRGGLALVFDRQQVKTLLGSQRFLDHAENKRRGHYLVDGFVLETMRRAGFKEYTHFPSLVQHVGTETTITNRVAPTMEQHLTAPSFPGESFDAMEFLNAKSASL